MPRRPLGRVLAVVAAGAVAVGIGVAAAPAHADDTPPPVVVDDAISIYPGQLRHIDVLANDSSPSGDDLALCRFPLPGENDHAAAFQEYVDDPGELLVLSDLRARGTMSIDYFVCDEKHLTPATLSISIRPVHAVNVRKVPGHPGRLQVTNHNDRSVKFLFGSPHAYRPDDRVDVPAGGTKRVTVRRHRIAWIAFIGRTGVADRGRVTDVRLTRPALPAPHSYGGGPAEWYSNRLFGALFSSVTLTTTATDDLRDFLRG